MLASRIVAAIGLVILAGTADAQKNTGGTDQGAAPATGGGLVSAADPQSVVSALQAMGHTATLGTDNLGDPMVSSETGGAAYNIYFYGCDDAHANCQWLQFSAGFDLPNGWTREGVDKWHTDQFVTIATLDAEQDPFVSLFVSAVGGLTQANFTDVVNQWGYSVADFKTATGFQ